MFYGSVSYFRLGAIYPRGELREPYPEIGRAGSRRRAGLMAVLAPVATPTGDTELHLFFLW